MVYVFLIPASIATIASMFVDNTRGRVFLAYLAGALGGIAFGIAWF